MNVWKKSCFFYYSQEYFYLSDLKSALLQSHFRLVEEEYYEYCPGKPCVFQRVLKLIKHQIYFYTKALLLNTIFQFNWLI
jgi:hypothetical protein